MSTDVTDVGGRRDGPSVDPVRDARTARTIAEALARRRLKIAAGEHVCPPWPEECDLPECQDRHPLDGPLRHRMEATHGESS